MTHRKVVNRQHHLFGIQTRREVVDHTQINFNHMQTILLGFVLNATLYIKVICLCKYVKFRIGV